MKNIRSEDEIGQYMEFVKDRPLNDAAYPLNSKRIEALGWQPKVSWEDGIQKTSKPCRIHQRCSLFKHVIYS